MKKMSRRKWDVTNMAFLKEHMGKHLINYKTWLTIKKLRKAAKIIIP